MQVSRINRLNEPSASESEFLGVESETLTVNDPADASSNPSGGGPVLGAAAAALSSLETKMKQDEINELKAKLEAETERANVAEKMSHELRLYAAEKVAEMTGVIKTLQQTISMAEMHMDGKKIPRVEWDESPLPADLGFKEAKRARKSAAAAMQHMSPLDE